MRKSNRGRKSKYETHVKPNFELIQSWREKGLSEETVAAKLNVAYSSLSLYKQQYPEFSEVLGKCKEKLGVKLKKTLWKETLGYTFEEIQEETEVEPHRNKNGSITEKIVKIKRKKIKRKCRPQPSLLMFALCNLFPDEFKRIDKEAIKEFGDLVDEKFRLNNSIFKKEFEKHYPKNKKNEDGFNG